MECVSWFEFMSQACDFGCGFLVFGCFRQLINFICVILSINLGLRLFKLGFCYKGLSKKLHEFDDFRKNGASLFEMMKKSDTKMKNSKIVPNGDLHDESGDLGDGDLSNVDEVFDVLSLRKMVKQERQRGDAAYAELEKERMAATTAADEAMAMIHRLQNEKCVVEMEANQYRRLVEEKQIHDQEVIQSLRWIIMKHELERSYMEDHLKFYKQRLKNLSKGDDVEKWEENGQHRSIFNSSNGEASPFEGLISSLDFDLTTP